MSSKLNTEKIVIRNLVEADKFHLTMFLMEPVALSYNPMTTLKEVEESVKVWLTFARLGSAFVAEVDGKPVGMANLYIQQFEKLKHQAMFVIIVGSDFRGQGIGTVLVKHLIKVAKEKYDMSLIHLEVYENNPARRLYRRLGFVEYGKHEKFVKEADGTYVTKILMQLEL